jgi:hypothetical protein
MDYWHCYSFWTRTTDTSIASEHGLLGQKQLLNVDYWYRYSFWTSTAGTDPAPKYGHWYRYNFWTCTSGTVTASEHGLLILVKANEQGLLVQVQLMNMNCWYRYGSWRWTAGTGTLCSSWNGSKLFQYNLLKDEAYYILSLLNLFFFIHILVLYVSGYIFILNIYI